MKRLALLMTVAGVVALYTGGCECSRKLESARKENQNLTQRVAELEDQLEQANAIILTSVEGADRSIYIVVEGDSLWSIAEKRLGSGTRYKEILALNPQIKKDEPLAVGTALVMPPK